MFAGRGDELRKIGEALFQTSHGNPQHFLIHGERGIGKSSLLLYVDALASGAASSLAGERFSFLTIQIELESADSPVNLVQKISRELEREINKKREVKEFGKGIWDVVKRVEAFGVKLRTAETSRSEMLLEDLVETIDKILSQIGTAIDGIILLIDEADKGAKSTNLGKFVKLFTERLTKHNCHKVCLGLAGISPLLEELKKSHESALRIFNIMELEPLIPDERKLVLRLGLQDAASKSGIDVSFEEGAEEMVSQLSEGYPHFIQQFAYCAYDQHRGNTITLSDVRSGAFDREGGAIHQLGQRYFQGLYFGQIGSDDYRKVLHAMASEADWVTKKQILTKTGLKPGTVNNAIQALKTREIIRAKPGRAGVYRLPSQSFKAWIRAFTANLNHPS
jgi:AAA ATPase domain